MELVVEDAVFVTMAEAAGPADGMLIRDGRIANIGRLRRSARPRRVPRWFGSAGQPSSRA